MIRTVLLSSLFVVGCMGTSAQAAETTAQFTTQASVISSCSLKQTKAIDTLKYDPVGINATQNAATQTPATFGLYEVRCNQQSGIKLSVDEGLNASAASSCESPLRNMRSAEGALLAYQLKGGPQPNLPILGCGSNTRDMDFTQTSVRTGAFYVLIPAGQDAKVGDYVDTITATVIF